MQRIAAARKSANLLTLWEGVPANGGSRGRCRGKCLDLRVILTGMVDRGMDPSQTFMFVVVWTLSDAS